MILYSSIPDADVGYLLSSDPYGYGGRLRYWSGTEWVKAHLKKYDGVSFVDAVMNIYRNGEWKPVDTSGV